MEKTKSVLFGALGAAMALVTASAAAVAEPSSPSLPPENAFTSFNNDTFASAEGLETDLRLVDRLADAGYDVLTHTLRSRPDLNSPETKAAAKRFFARAHARGLKVYMDTDPRIARHAYLEKHPDQKQGVLRFGLASATNGTATVEIVQPAVDDHMSWGSSRPYEAVSAAFVKAWAIRTAADGTVTARAADARAANVAKDRLTVVASGLEADETLAALVRFDLWSIDIFSPGLLAYERELMATYRELGADGGMRDEWGFPPSVLPGMAEHRTFWYSKNYADAYAKATGGRDLAADALLFAFPLKGRAAERSKAITAYMRLNYERNTAIERDFYETDKRLFGPGVYVCKHATWYPIIGWREFLHDGLDWWSATRDWAQTDEVTPVPAACGMAKKFGGATWMNEGYQNDPKKYAPMVWRYALAGGRMVFHPVYHDDMAKYKNMKRADAKIARHTDIADDSKRARECVRLLSRISSAPIDCPVAYVFGHRRVAWDWSDPAWGDWGGEEVYALWCGGWGVDLYPSTEFATFKVDADGWLTVGKQRYAALVTHHLDEDDRAQLKALLAKGVTKTRVFDKADGVAAYLASVKGLSRQTPPDIAAGNGLGAGFGEWKAVLPPPDGTVTLTDGTRARIKAVQSSAGDPISGVLELADGRRYEYAARGIFAASAKQVAGAGVTRIKGPGVDFSSAEPRDVVLPLTDVSRGSPFADLSFEVPKVRPCDELTRDGLKALWIESVPLKGRPTQVFAYLAMPAGASVSNRVPGVVLAHGGAGTAYPTWARTWARKGYAAIVVDNCGQLPIRSPNGGWLPSGIGGPAGWGRTDLGLEKPGDQWPYHAVAALVRAHSYLRSLDAVDPEKTGITGISWGGYLTMLAAATDRRYKFAMPVYACADFAAIDRECPFFRRERGRGSAEAIRRWDDLFDAKHYAPRMDLPVFWFASSNDAAFPFDLLQRTVRMPKKTPGLAVRVRMVHTHGPKGENMPELFRFADSIVRGAPALPTVAEPVVRDGRVTVSFDSKSWKIARVDLNWCADEQPAVKSDWKVVRHPAPAGRVFEAPVPAEAKWLYVNLVLEGDSGESVYPESVVSSPAILLDAALGCVWRPAASRRDRL